MSFQPIKFYQTGTFTVGNRLLAPEERSVQANMRRTNSLNSGHRACQGCGEALGARYAIDAAMKARMPELQPWSRWCQENCGTVYLPSGASTGLNGAQSRGTPLHPFNVGAPSRMWWMRRWLT